MTALSVARWLVSERGCSVIPLDHPEDTWLTDRKRIGKTPACKWERFQTERASDETLNEWFGNGRQRNIGIVTGRVSGLVVLDADSPEALAWMRAHLPPTYAGTQTTKGQHWYFRHPGSRVRNKVRIRTEDPAIKIDVRADGGYVVAPGSLHVSGARYERIGPWPPFDCLPVFDPAWIDPATDPGADEDAGDAPDAAPLFTAPADREALRRRARAYLEAMGPAIEGQGGDAHTLRAAFALRDFGLSEGDAFEVLHDWNQACEPPWSEGELREKIANAWKYAERPAGTKVVDRPRPINGTPMAGAGARAERVAADTVSDGAAVTFARTDLGNAEAFASATRDRLRFDHRHGRWLLFEGHRWRPDVDAAVWRLLTATTRRRLHAALELNDEADRRAAVKWALSSEARPKLEAALALGARLAPLADAGDAWDADPFLLGVENGVVDLRTGVLRPGRPEDRITRACAAAFDPAAPAPRWERFIREVLCQFDDDGTIDEARTAGVVGFLHRALGYSLTGDTSEQALWLLHGGGSNGKTILLETIADVLGDYAYAAPFSTFVYQPNPGGIPNDLAALEGRRFVICTEATDGVRLNETRLKAFSGGDTMAARFMRAEFFTLKPAGKVWLAFNRKPIVRDDSNGFWRRVRMVPFLRTFEKNGSLKAALLAERAGILRWLVEGCRAWQRDGLGLPDAVRDATDGYQAESDPIREFLETVCDTSDRLAETPAADLYTSYCEWAEVVKLADRERLTRHAFGRLATERFKRRRSARGRWYVGLRVRQRSEWSRDEDEA